MKSVVLLGVLGLAAFADKAFAQTPAPELATLEETAQKRHAEWESLAKDLSERMARILPCDARYAAGIAEVSRASDARVVALADYLRAASAQAFAETAAAKILLDAEERNAVEAGLARGEAAREKTAVDIQADALAQSAKQRVSLEDSQRLLQQIAEMIRQRASAAELRAGAADSAVAQLRALIGKLDARDATLRDASAAFEAERSRWNGYYSARKARAQVECSITQIGVSRNQGKQ